MTSSRNKKHMRVVMILGSLPPMPVGGAELQAIKLCNELKKQGIFVSVLTWGKFWHKKNDSYQGIPFTRIKSFINLPFDVLTLFRKKKATKQSETKIVYDDKVETTDKVVSKVWLGMRIRYILFYINCLLYLWAKRKEFDIIHVHMMEWPAFVATWIGKKLKKDVLIKDSTMNGIFNLLRYPSGRKKSKEIADYSYYVAMTNAIYLNFIKADLHPERIARIPNGIEISSSTLSRPHWRNKVVFVGNLTQQPAKGVDVLLLAWKKVVRLVPNATLQIVGNGDIASYQAFTSIHGINNSVEFLGKKDDIKSILTQSDIFVLPSRREGMSNALMEAMLFSMPIVATKISGNEDLIENNVSGILVPAGHITELSDAIIYMLTHRKEAQKMGKMAYKSVVENCDIAVVARKYVQLYTQILDKN